MALVLIKFIYNLVEKSNIINKCCDVILVFSNDLEYNQFQYKDVFKTLILPENYISKNMVTFKKYYALRTLKQTYSYYIICDSEIDIIDENFTHENVVEKIKTSPNILNCRRFVQKPMKNLQWNHQF